MGPSIILGAIVIRFMIGPHWIKLLQTQRTPGPKDRFTAVCLFMVVGAVIYGLTRVWGQIPVPGYYPGIPWFFWLGIVMLINATLTLAICYWIGLQRPAGWWRCKVTDAG